MSIHDNTAKNLFVDRMYPKFYLQMYNDLKIAFGDDVEKAKNHYLQHGIKEGRMPNPFINPQFYLNKYPDLVAAFGPNNYVAAFDHWLTYGFKEGRQGCIAFDIGFYLSSNPDLVAAFGPQGYAEAFEHWKNYGHNKGEKTTAEGYILKLSEPGSSSTDGLEVLKYIIPDVNINVNVEVSVSSADIKDIIREFGKAIIDVHREWKGEPNRPEPVTDSGNEDDEEKKD